MLQSMRSIVIIRNEVCMGFNIGCYSVNMTYWIDTGYLLEPLPSTWPSQKPNSLREVACLVFRPIVNVKAKVQTVIAN